MTNIIHKLYELYKPFIKVTESCAVMSTSDYADSGAADYLEDSAKNIMLAVLTYTPEWKPIDEEAKSLRYIFIRHKTTGEIGVDKYVCGFENDELNSYPERFEYVTLD